MVIWGKVRPCCPYAGLLTPAWHALQPAALRQPVRQVLADPRGAVAPGPAPSCSLGAQAINHQLMIYGGGNKMAVDDRPRPRGRGRPTAALAPDHRWIMDRTLTLFSRHGFDAVSMRDIAADCGVDAALLSRQFASKQKLWEAVIEDVAATMQRWQAPIWAAQSDPAPIRARLSQALCHFVRFCVEIPELNRLFTYEVRTHGPRADFVLKTLWAPHRAALLPLMVEAAKADILTIADPELATTMVIGMACVPIVMETCRQDARVSADFIDLLSRSLVGAIVKPM